MNKDLYESHITINESNESRRKQLETYSAKWKYSYIVNDPILGKRHFCYLTKYANTYEAMLAEVKKAANDLRSLGFDVVREKIEHIVYDTKTGVTK